MNSLVTIDHKNCKRNINIDFLKILACITVIGLHTLQKDLTTVNALIHYFCGFAIPVFFFSTGYILLQRKKITFKYCIKKCLNIIRVVVIWNVGVNLCIVCLKIFGGKEIDFISFLQDISYRPFIQKGRMWQFWYLGAMIILYLLLPIIHKATYGNNDKWIRFWGVFIIHPLINTVCIHFIAVDSVLISFVYFVLITLLSFAVTYILSKLPFSRYFLKI